MNESCKNGVEKCVDLVWICSDSNLYILIRTSEETFVFLTTTRQVQLLCFFFHFQISYVCIQFIFVISQTSENREKANNKVSLSLGRGVATFVYKLSLSFTSETKAMQIVLCEALLVEKLFHDQSFNSIAFNYFFSPSL